MDLVRSESKSFLEHVAETHVDQYLCPEADELRQHAVSAFYRAYRRHDPSGNPIWLTRGTHVTRIKAKEVTFSLSTPRLSRKKTDITDQSIAVIANNDLLNPVAFIFPTPGTDESCASVVVADTVNDPNH